ncbi:hypothetical protein BD410DRAFT_790601 [Rickenella mellea]|uniref:Uncharacterized protein n=1 Tax=Rickenella mellea TaxID=50990 RepID=A0A4Y7Q1A5_9AGAM|nr:hypothetical protein BD410DRAFT_790601 [Rickenella mellea]
MHRCEPAVIVVSCLFPAARLNAGNGLLGTLRRPKGSVTLRHMIPPEPVFVLIVRKSNVIRRFYSRARDYQAGMRDGNR